jgi:hypothetical protein
LRAARLRTRMLASADRMFLLLLRCTQPVGRIVDKKEGLLARKQVFREQFAIMVRIQYKEPEQRMT